MAFKQNNKKLKKLPSLDLHGLSQESAYEKIDRFIHKHNQAGTSRVCIMPGKGTGVIKSQLINYLKQAGYSWHYETLPNGKKNEGVLIVPMD